MKLTKPWFYDEFVCTASSCTDNCCIGWEIDIDESAMERFSEADGTFGERLRSAIHTEGDCPTFAMCEGERCALLREDGLCELILNMGEDSLCDICALHPRFFGWFNDHKEAGLGMCCEEVCRLMFSDSRPMSFISEEIDEPCEENCADDILDYLRTVRKSLYKFLQDREMPLRKRLQNTVAFAREVQTFFCNPGEECEPVSVSTDLSTVLSELFGLYGEAESINSEWDGRYNALCSSREEIAASFADFLAAQADELWRYEHIAVYTLYRYFLDGVFEAEIISRIGMVCFTVLGVALLDCLKWLEKGELSEWDRIVNLKLFSKQFEYSEENLELIYNAVLDNELLAPESLAACF